ncbi:hypothetical protein SUGI_0321980 [Cryptomeria japonica]|nr:hypothetical protein SUGI_0321980 [Cryptomeria japonica]
MGAEESELTNTNGGLSFSEKLLIYAGSLGTFLLLGIWLLNCNLCSKGRAISVPNSHSSKFTAQNLSFATREYHEDNLMSSSHWSSLYKGIFQDGLMVAIKRLHLDNSEEAKQIFSEVSDGLIKLRHQNLLRVLGSTTTSDYMQLVMEYVDHKSLHHYLHQGDPCNLSWETRLKIAHGIACALAYLHQECKVNNKSSIVHGNLKPSNIFVNVHNQEPLVSDYGISSLIENYSHSSSAFKEELYGYAAPECKRSEQTTRKSDVYSYGVLLLELLTMRRPTSEDIVGDLPGWVRIKLCDGYPKSMDCVFYRTASTSAKKKMVRVLGLALICTRDDPERRPSMKEVLQMLRQIMKENEERVVPAPLCDIDQEV